MRPDTEEIHEHREQGMRDPVAGMVGDLGTLVLWSMSPMPNTLAAKICPICVRLEIIVHQR